MSDSIKQRERKVEIVSFFYMIFSHRIREGVSPDESRKEAYDAVTLRYGISKGRLLNIISEQKISRKENISALRHNALSLIRDLLAVNDELDLKKEKNERLIGLLKECTEDDS